MDKDYFEQLKKQIDSSINKDELKKQIEIKVKELTANFTNVNLNDFLDSEKEKLLKNLGSNYNQNYNIDKNNFNIIELLKNINNKENQNILINFLDKSNARNYLDVFSDLLSDKKFDDEFKTKIFFILCEQQVDQEFLMRKSFKKFIVNPVKMNIIEKISLLGNIKKIIDYRVATDNPSWANVCYMIAENYFFVAFPDWPDSEYAKNSLVKAIIESSKQLLNIDDEINLTSFEYNQDYVDQFLEFFEKYKVLTS